MLARLPPHERRIPHCPPPPQVQLIAPIVSVGVMQRDHTEAGPHARGRAAADRRATLAVAPP
eukprot:2994360-Prymnesium_polylepis.1